MASTKDLTIKRVTDDYLDSIDIHNPPAPEQVAYDIIALERNEFDLYNSAAMKNATLICANVFRELKYIDCTKLSSGHLKFVAKEDWTNEVWFN